MIRKINFLILLLGIVSTPPFSSCQKKLFSYVEIKGRTLDKNTNEPLSVKVELRVHYEGDNNGERYTVSSSNSNSDGTFTLKSKAYKNADHYCLFINDQYYDQLNQSCHVEVKKNETVDIGDILFQP